LVETEVTKYLKNAVRSTNHQKGERKVVTKEILDFVEEVQYPVNKYS
jgi:hypothetical protein